MRPMSATDWSTATAQAWTKVAGHALTDARAASLPGGASCR